MCLADLMATSLPLYRTGKEKIVAVGATRRLPDVPALAEAGVPGFSRGAAGHTRYARR
jgi:tripartite-type tricarboxylate transporter receptor subunit TctC